MNTAIPTRHSVRSSKQGPLAGCRSWLEAERLTRGELWPGLQALAQKLWTIALDHNGKDTTTLPDLDG
jgi:hypothetical protein